MFSLLLTGCVPWKHTEGAPRQRDEGCDTLWGVLTMPMSLWRPVSTLAWPGVYMLLQQQALTECHGFLHGVCLASACLFSLVGTGGAGVGRCWGSGGRLKACFWTFLPWMSKCKALWSALEAPGLTRKCCLSLTWVSVKSFLSQDEGAWQPRGVLVTEVDLRFIFSCEPESVFQRNSPQRLIDCWGNLKRSIMSAWTLRGRHFRQSISSKRTWFLILYWMSHYKVPYVDTMFTHRSCLNFLLNFTWGLRTFAQSPAKKRKAGYV